MRIQIWIFGFKGLKPQFYIWNQRLTVLFITDRSLLYFDFLKKKQIVTSQVLTGVIRKNSAKQ